MIRFAQATLLAATLALAACNGHGATARYVGLYQDSFETQAFTAEGTTQAWWVTFESEAQGAMTAAKQKNPESPPFGFRLTVEFEGRLSEPGHYGHLGAYPRHLTVTRVLSVKPASKP